MDSFHIYCRTSVLNDFSLSVRFTVQLLVFHWRASPETSPVIRGLSLYNVSVLVVSARVTTIGIVGSLHRNSPGLQIHITIGI